MIDQIGDLLSKEYEDLTFEEIATRIAENKRQINKLLNLNDTNEEEVQDSSNNWTILFQRATSTGDISKLKEMLSNQEIKSHIDINAGDTPPLIYAACFGKIQVTELLLEAGADINIQDSRKPFIKLGKEKMKKR
jgi:ankyrin repeat protein